MKTPCKAMDVSKHNFSIVAGAVNDHHGVVLSRLYNQIILSKRISYKIY
jgi:hypothetical protein